MNDPERDGCLKRRLLFACVASYHPERPDLQERVGWKSGFDLVEDPDPDPEALHIDAALVGRIEEGVLVAFRGTLPPFVRDEYPPKKVLKDWLNNLDFQPVAEAPYPGLVHRGFAGSVARLWGTPHGPGLEASIRRHLDLAPRRRLFVTGHSKGGALANLAAWRALSLPALEVPIRVFTIAAARAGTEAWREGYERETRIRCTRYESALDLVPYVPFGRDTPYWVRKLLGKAGERVLALNYVPVGTRIPAKTSLPEIWGAFKRWSRWLFRPRPAIEDYMPLLASAHDIGPESGYDTLICEPGCGPAHQLCP